MANLYRARALWEVNLFLIEVTFANVTAIHNALYELTGHINLTEAERKDEELQKRVIKLVQDKTALLIAKHGDDAKKTIGFDIPRGAQRADELLEGFPQQQKGLCCHNCSAINCRKVCGVPQHPTHSPAISGWKQSTRGLSS